MRGGKSSFQLGAGSRPRGRRRNLPVYDHLEPRSLFSIFTVSSTADSDAGTLRQAILDANALAGTDTIVFAISGTGVKTISPISSLPTITSPVFIDGSSQAGYAGTPLIELNGTSAGSLTTGLTVTAGASMIR